MNQPIDNILEHAQRLYLDLLLYGIAYTGKNVKASNVERIDPFNIIVVNGDLQSPGYVNVRKHPPQEAI